MEWADKYVNLYDTMTKVTNYYLGLTKDKNIVYDNLHTSQKYSDLLQMFTDNYLELKVKCGYYYFLDEKLCVISRIHPRDWYKGYKVHIDDFSELLKRINNIIECSLDPAIHLQYLHLPYVSDMFFCLCRCIRFLFLFVLY
jgi:hypothetical protein